MRRLLILTFFVQIFDGLPISDILDDDIVVPMSKSPDGQLFKVSLQDYLTSGLINRWPNNTVPYLIDPDSNFTSYHKALIEHMTTIFHRYTCIKFVPWTGHQDCCVVITDGKGCSSFVGFQGKKQQMTLAKPGSRPGDHCIFEGHILHEMMHALGFFHEHSRADRDRYVKILEENVRPGKMGQFAKQAVSPINIFQNPYDYGSILHYSAFAFSRNETFLRTIDTLKPADIGQRYFLSHLDVTKIKHFYQCTEIDTKLRTKIIKDVKEASCTFDYGFCGWTQDYKIFPDDRPSLTLNDSFSDDFDFLSLNSSTLFSEFTPTKDHTTGFGHFLLAASYDPRYTGDRARLRSPIFQPKNDGGLICIKFYYYMNPTQSSGMAGYLRMYVVAYKSSEKLEKRNKETQETLIWAANNVPTAGPMWHKAVKQIRLLGHKPIQFVIEATTGDVENSDIGIDDIEITTGKCDPKI